MRIFPPWGKDRDRGQFILFVDLGMGRKINSLWFVVCSLWINAHAQTDFSCDWAKKNKIKSLTAISETNSTKSKKFLFDNKGRMIAKQSFTNGFITYEVRYDTLGLGTNEIRYCMKCSQFGSPEKSPVILMVPDTESCEINYYDRYNKPLVTGFIQVYHTTNKMGATEKSSNTHLTCFTYFGTDPVNPDSIINSTVWDGDTVSKAVTSYKYTDKKNFTEINTYYFNGGGKIDSHTKETFEYDSKNRLIVYELTDFDSGDNVTSTYSEGGAPNGDGSYAKIIAIRNGEEENVTYTGLKMATKQPFIKLKPTGCMFMNELKQLKQGYVLQYEYY